MVSVIKVNGKTIKNDDLKAEATVNGVYHDGVISIGKNDPKSANMITGSVPDAGVEPDQATVAHLHPVAGNESVQINTTNINLKGGSPSPTDYNEHTRAWKHSERTHGARSIMVDQKNIYLYNSSPNQTIVVPRPK